MLFLVGLGLSEQDISLKALEICKREGVELYAERYTSNIGRERMDWISKESGKEVKLRGRQDMEDRIKDLVAQSKKNDIAILTGGDPLMATTHKIVYIEAKKQGAKIAVVHSNSILTSAIGESGLDFYRFGQICTIPTWSEHYKPVSFYETIEKNQRSNLHSLLLLDYDQDAESSIQPSYAIQILEEAEKNYKRGIIKEGTKLIILHNLSIKGETKQLTTIGEARKGKASRGPTVFILPAQISDTESEILTAMFGV